MRLSLFSVCEFYEIVLEVVGRRVMVPEQLRRRQFVQHLEMLVALVIPGACRPPVAFEAPKMNSDVLIVNPHVSRRRMTTRGRTGLEFISKGACSRDVFPNLTAFNNAPIVDCAGVYDHRGSVVQEVVGGSYHFTHR
jgi:hypothetical protein